MSPFDTVQLTARRRERREAPLPVQRERIARGLNDATTELLNQLELRLQELRLLDGPSAIELAFECEQTVVVIRREMDRVNTRQDLTLLRN